MALSDLVFFIFFVLGSLFAWCLSCWECSCLLGFSLGVEKGDITKGVFSLEESLEFLDSLESRKWSGLKRPLFQNTPFPNPISFFL